jgi:sialate O-acetylesterase
MLLLVPEVKAQSVSSLFANNMMFQRDKPIKVFGKATAGQTINVAIGGRSTSVTADGSGKWIATLDSLPAGGPHTLTINSLTFTNILIGDIWFCSGQSNIQIILNSDADAATEIPKANYPNMRIMRVNTEFPTTDTTLPTLVKWSAVTPDTADSFSAVGYYFGRGVHTNLNIPIGLIDVTRGGTKSEAWTPGNEFSDHPIGTAIVDYYNNLPNGHPAKQEQDAPGALYPVFVEPFTPFAMKGVLWYQGEHNTGRQIVYHFTLSNMIATWRERFQQPDLPFLIVQLANYGDTATTLKNSEIAALRGIQADVANSVTNVEYISIIDTGNGDGNIHPDRKQPVGQRAALAARKAVYGQNLVWTGPRFASASFSSSDVTISFSELGGGLASVTPNAFLISSNPANGFVRATAQVVGNTVKVSGVNNPVAVRYAWEDMPRVNLFNAEELPVAPFRTDKWFPFNLAPFNWSNLATKSPLDNTDGDAYPNYVEFFANMDFKVANNDPVIWKVTSPFPNTTAYRYRRRDYLWTNISYKIQTSPTNVDSWSDLAHVNYPDPAPSNSAVNYHVDYERFEVHVPGNVKVRLAITLSNQTYYTQGDGPTDPPAAPSGLGALAQSSSSIALQWTDLAGDETGFKVESRTGTNAFSQVATVGANVTNYTHTGLTANTAYTYRVRAYNLNGDSGYSAEASATTPAPVIPTAPSNLSATAKNASSIGLVWADNSNSEEGFKIESRTGTNAFSQITTVSANATNYTHTGLTAETSYTYRVRAFSVAGDSDYTSEATATTASPSETGTWIEENGVVVMEAENAEVLANNDTILWAALSTNSVVCMDAGYRAATNASWASGTEMKFTVQITTPGTYNLRVRRRAVDGYADSGYLGLNDTQIGSSQFTGVAADFTWSTSVSLGTLAAGDHVIQIRRREAGLQIDRVMLAINSADFPAAGEVGPAESARSGGTVNPYTAWADSYQLAQDQDGDDDGDGVSNFIEYALRGNPTNTASAGHIEYGIAPNAAGFDFVYARRTTAGNGLTYHLELCTNLVSGVWTNSGYTALPAATLDADFEIITNRISTAGDLGKFIRLRIER